MDRSAAVVLMNQIHAESVVHTVANSGHDLMFNNPLECSRNVISFAYGLDELQNFKADRLEEPR